MMPWLSPLALVVLALPLALLGIALRRLGVQLLSALLLLVGLAAMTPIVANALLGTLESQATPVPGECDGVEAVVLLAGGLQRPAGHSTDFSALTEASLQRGLYYLELGHDPRLPLVVAGGSRYAVAESQVLGALLAGLGLRAEPFVLETDSRSTAGNAVEVRELLPQARRIALATSAVHMPRARRAFERAGFEVCRRPLDRMHLEPGGPWAFWPQVSALRKTEMALHELVGDLYYRWRDR
jgi:uncharacterized SAM-binding protein YcdF (DUF218 family)